ncbi:MAG: ParB/RepB/Spo0J family partition protein [Candidatus Nealsonbacteria bacterium]|nr:ParB/RepB/Spo0J family partition protein [Candidatus Nealsonbacteria bacterium]
MKQTFGKGLESLIPKKDNGDQGTGEIKQEPIFYIDIAKIKSNPYQPRRIFDQDGLKSLAESIKEHGILQPLLVSRIQKESDGVTEYQLVAGERRLLASKMAGLSQVPVIVRDPTEQEKLEIALIENIQREDLNPMEKAEAYKRLQSEFKLLQKDIAQMVGKSREAVANTMRLVDLPLEIKEGIKENKISEGHARAILALQDIQKQKDVFAQVVRNGLSVRDAESLVQKLNIWQPIKKQITAASKEMKNLEEEIRNIFGIKNIKLRIESGLPKLIVFFNSKKELENLLKKIK